MKNICIIGTGYVGLVTGACFAELGNHVRCVDIDESKVASLNKGVMPIFEPGLEQIVQRNMEMGRLIVTASYEVGVKDADFVFMAVGTPNTPTGEIDLSYLHGAYQMMGASLNGARPIVVNKSTVLPGTGDLMEGVIANLTNGAGPLSVVSNPEFLREGRAIHDFMNPSRVVVGGTEDEAINAVAELYRPLNCPIILTDRRSAEMTKYASNAFLAMKISFINEIAAICDETGVSVTSVAEGIGLDPRIGKDYLNAGLGYGGSCLPKDMAGLASFASQNGIDSKILNAVMEVNSDQPKHLLRQVEQALGTLKGARVAVLGLTFKPDTDDLRHSAALEIISLLLDEGAEVVGCDPKAILNVRALPSGVTYVPEPYQAAQGADAVIIATEWQEYVQLDLQRLKSYMNGNVLADGRNVLDPEKAQQAGLFYIGVGTGIKRCVQSAEFATATKHSD